MLSYDKYIEIGGSVEEEDFPIFLTQANLKLDFMTMGKWKDYDYGGDLNCELLVTKIINLLHEQSQSTRGGVRSYSNGIESITYDDAYSDKSINKQIKNMCVEHLQGTNLMYRGVTK